MTAVRELEPCAIAAYVDVCVVTIRVAGELDGEAWPSLERALLACLMVDSDDVVVDFEAVSFVSVSACRQLHPALRTLRVAKQSVVVKPSRALARVVSLFVLFGVLEASEALLLDG